MKAVRTIIYILLAIGLVWLMVLLFNKVFSSSTTNTITTTASKPAELVSYADTDTTVAMYIDGPTRAKTEHESLKVTVGRSQVQIQLFQGFGEQLVRQESFANTTTSYAAFLKALDRAQFDAAVSTEVSADERGYCPQGNRFIYTIEGSDIETIRKWTSTCGIGNFRGEHPLIRKLFIDQVPRDTLRSVLRDSDISTN